ncbi:MAG TPA: c-type cytochrome [Candidatus Angelobacter sp.]|nr:c-type cytochrome [Candidatus Angelobacter sp.]
MKAAPLTLLAAAIVFAMCAHPARSAAGTDDAMRDRGKQIFAAKCAQCHDVDATKKLPDGSTLLARLVASSDPRARLATRLNKMSSEDHQAVVVYMEELIARYPAGNKAPPASQ